MSPSLKLSPGTKVATTSGQECVVLKYVDRGSQGDVYLGFYDGRKVCLKLWREDGAITDEQRMSLARYVEEGPATDSFVRVLDTVPSVGSAVPAGYVMDWVDLEEMGGIDTLKLYTPLPPLSHLVDLGLMLVHSLRRLHLSGLAYLDFSSANVLFDFLKGLRICLLDPDNTTPDSVAVGICGTPGCIAPEIITRRAAPSVQTDVYCLSVMLFQLLNGGMHPLYGRAELKFLTDCEKTRLYLEAYHPVFVFDPKTPENRPDNHCHGRLIYCWSGLPQFIRELFTKAFTEGLHHPERRICESTWFEALQKLRGLVTKCPACSEERFADPVNGSGSAATLCRNCQRKYPVGPRLVFRSGREVVLTEGTRIQSGQLSTRLGKDDWNRDIAVIRPMRRAPSRLVIENVSESSWTVSNNGRPQQVGPTASTPVIAGTQIFFTAVPEVGIVIPSSSYKE